jgi:Flp pilus assembly protein TadD
MAYDEALKLNPKDADVWADKGVALKMLGRTIESNGAFAKVKELGYKD